MIVIMGIKRLKKYNSCSSKMKPVIFITWGTEDIFKDEGETYEAGSGYFLNDEYVITAKHIGEMIRGKLNNNQVKQPPYNMQVHDPRSKLNWIITDEHPLTDSDISILKVKRKKHNLDDKEILITSPIHRTTPIMIGEKLTILGFSNINAIRYDELDEHGNENITISADGYKGYGVVEEICPQGYSFIKNSCVKIKHVAAVGSMSGGPVVDAKGRIVGTISASLQEANYTVISDWSNLLHPKVKEGSKTKGRIEFTSDDWIIGMTVNNNYSFWKRLFLQLFGKKAL